MTTVYDAIYEIKYLARRLIDTHPLLYRMLEKGWYIAYWSMIYAANMTGKIPAHHLRDCLYRTLFHIRLPKSSTIYGGCTFFSPWKMQVGEHSILGDHGFFDAREKIRIGENVNIGKEIRVFTLEHDILSPTFGEKGGQVTIGDWAYIGSRVTILPLVSIGEGAVVASGAVVARDVPPWVMVGGVPARYIRDRPKVAYTLGEFAKILFQ